MRDVGQHRCFDATVLLWEGNLPISQPGFELPDVNQTNYLFQGIRGSGQER